MTAPAKTNPSLTGPLLIWLAIQLAALWIGTTGVQLSAKAVRPPESIAIDVMLVTQIAAAAILWPWLFRQGRLALAVIATALPFTQAAGFLSATPIDRVVGVSGLLVLWLASLSVLPTTPLAPSIRALLVLTSIGGALASYLRAEFAPPQSSTTPLGPIMWTLGELFEKSGLFPWICSGVLLIVCILTRAVMNRVRRRTLQT